MTTTIASFAQNDCLADSMEECTPGELLIQILEEDHLILTCDGNLFFLHCLN